MTSNASFLRKVTYISVIAILLIPLSLLSRPTTRKKVGERFQTQPGGVLATMREEAGMSQAQLGTIDPASEAMRLATLGMRGVAVNVLWDRAHLFKKKQNWDSLSATLEQISRLQPNFVSVWEFQAHNLSYNVSIEFDDYRQRYHWVKKGIDYLLEGIVYNENDPRLLWYAGWVIGQKMGRSDERVQFRNLFGEDTEFHALLNRQQIDVASTKGPDGKPNAWLCGRLWYLKAQAAVDSGKSLHGKAPAIFHSSPVMSRINFVSDMEKEPQFDEERVRSDWKTSGEEWFNYGKRPLPSSGGFNIQLNEMEATHQQFLDTFAQLETLAPGAREAIMAEKRRQLPEDLLAALEKPEAERTPAEQVRAGQATERLAPTSEEIAARVPREQTLKARQLAKELLELAEKERLIRTSRGVVNFDFWRARCESGASEVSTRARKHLFEADAALAQSDLELAREKYELSFREWAELLKTWPVIKDDGDLQELFEATERYINTLDQLDLRDPSGGILSPDFPLADFFRGRGDEAILKFRKEPLPPVKSSTKAEKTPSETSKKSETTGEVKSDKETTEADKPADPAPPATEKPADDKPKSDAAEAKPADEKPVASESSQTENEKK